MNDQHALLPSFFQDFVHPRRHLHLACNRVFAVMEIPHVTHNDRRAGWQPLLLRQGCPAGRRPRLQCERERCFRRKTSDGEKKKSKDAHGSHTQFNLKIKQVLVSCSSKEPWQKVIQCLFPLRCIVGVAGNVPDMSDALLLEKGVQSLTHTQESISIAAGEPEQFQFS